MGSTLGDLKVLHEGGVSKEVSPSRGEAREKRVLQLLQLDLKLILLPSKLRLQRYKNNSRDQKDSHTKARTCMH